MSFEIIKTHPDSPEAKNLIEELSHSLYAITGDDGKSSFNSQVFDLPGSSFIVLRKSGVDLACGSIWPISDDVCEIKRMYSKKPGQGFGWIVLRELEKLALEFGYKEIWLSTRKINKQAVDFYLNNNYLICESYGKYKQSSKSICLSKKLRN